MRLFVAINLPEEVKRYLRGLQEQLAQINGAQFVFTHDFHMTLKFLGECDESARLKIEELLSGVKFAEFSASLGQFGFFGTPHSPKVLWVGLNVPSWLAQTAKEIGGKENSFVPHITLARCKNFPKGVNVAQVLQNIKVSPMQFSVSQFHLYESKLSSAGSTHLILKSFPL